LDPGDLPELQTRHSKSAELGNGWQIHPRVTLLHLDASVAIVNKGPGLLSVPATGADLSALSILADFLAGRLQSRNFRQSSLPASYRRLEPLPVHRLDQYTTGIFCLAMNPGSRRHLIEQIKEHTMHREYIAFVEGQPAAPRGTWRNWVELSRDEMRQTVVEAPAGDRKDAGIAREAITHYEVIETFPAGSAVVTKLRLVLETGRKHQIRLQASHFGLPLVGDRTYNPRTRLDNPSGDMLVAFPRQALHSSSLTMEHPEQKGRTCTWTAGLPEDLRRLEAALRAGSR